MNTRTTVFILLFCAMDVAAGVYVINAYRDLFNSYQTHSLTQNAGCLRLVEASS